MKIVADENIPLVRRFFGHLGEVVTLPGRSLGKRDLVDADILLVRSITRVNEALLAGTAVKFVGTCTIGTDHLDQAWLSAQAIGFASAPGCNADSVADYVLAVLSALALKHKFSLFDRTLGIVGMGAVGGRVKARMEKLGVACLGNDPPLEAAGTAGLVGLDELIEKSDVICLHTPLTESGEYPTRHLLDSDRIAQLRSGTILISAGRGAVIDNQALLQRMTIGRDILAVLDVWENEPDIDPALLAACDIGTPHIAGYSGSGKIRGTAMVYRAACEHFGVVPELDFSAVKRGEKEIILGGNQCSVEGAFYQAVLACYDPRVDDKALREKVAMAGGFDELRKNYPQRIELNEARIAGRPDSAELARLLSAVGIMHDGPPSAGSESRD